MIEGLFAAWLAVVGVLVLSPASRSIPPWGATFLAPLAATALAIFAGLLLIVPASYSIALWVVVTTVAALVVLCIAFAKRLVTIDWLVRSIGGSVGLALVISVLAWNVPMVRFTSDSYHYLMSALALVRSGTLEGVVDPYLLKRQLATPLLHTLGVLTGRGYVSFWTPLLGVATFGTLTWLAVTGLRLMSVPLKWRWAILGPVLLLALTTNRILFHFFYINGHMLFAGLLLGGVGLAWLAARTTQWVMLVPASLMFGALIPLRPESALVVGAFLAVFLASPRIPALWRWVLLGPFALATVAWDGLVLPRLLSDTTLELIRAPLGDIVVVAVLIMLTALATSGHLAKVTNAAPWIAMGVLAVTLGGFIAGSPQLMIETVKGIATALTMTGNWGLFWLVMPFLALGAAIVGFRGDRYILFGLRSFPLIIPILAYLRGSPFHEGPRDSANRMIMHIVPLLLLTVVLAAGSALRTWNQSEAPKPDPGVGDPSDRETKTTIDAPVMSHQSLTLPG